MLDFDFKMLAFKTHGFSSADIVDYVRNVQHVQSNSLDSASFFRKDLLTGKFYPCIEEDEESFKMMAKDVLGKNQMLYPPLDMYDFLTHMYKKSTPDSLNHQYEDFNYKYGTHGGQFKVTKIMQNKKTTSKRLAMICI